ncbi:hypothetical protein ACHAQD_007699 [Fusarium lateritium]
MEVTLSLRNAFVAFIVLICTILFLFRRLGSGKSDGKTQKPQARDLRGRSPFNILYDPKANTQNATEAEVDIIAVHGLGSNVDRTWTWRGTGHSQKTVNWLNDPDMLQSKIPNARILAFNYDSTWLSDAPRTRVELCGEELVQSLHRLRPESDRPIIFVAHSFGGLVVQDALMYAHREKQYHHILHHIKGFISLGTPFRGTKVQWAADLMARIMRFAGSHHHILSLLVYDNPQLRDKVHSLGRLRKTFSFPIFCFFELNQTQFAKIPLFPSAFQGMVVEESSACLAGDERSHLQTDHINLNKYSSPDDRSFLSVSAEIVRMCHNASHVVSVADPETTTPIQKGHWMVPFGQNKGFVGRNDILPDLLVRIQPDCQKNACQRTAVEGLGGIGKSQIALEAAFRLRDLDPTCSVFWVPALSTITFENAYRDIARVLKIPLPEGESSNVLPLIKQALSNEAVGKWLLIVDNADDPSLMFGPGSLESQLPSSPHGSILFTTRTSEVTNLLDIPSMDTFRIEEMSQQEAADLMGTRLSPSQMEDVENLHALLEILCYLPLALKQAAAYMQLHRISPKHYIHRCQSSDKGIIRLLSRGFGDRTRRGDAEHPVAKTWLISFIHLSSNNPLASQYLQFMSFLSEKNIPLSILPPEDDLEAQEAIGVLQAYCFVTAREDREFVDMHRLVRLAIRNWLEEKGEEVKSYANVQVRMLDLFRVLNEEDQAEWVKYIPHFHIVVDEDALSNSTKAAWCLLARLSAALTHMLMFGDALNLSQRAEKLGAVLNDPNDLEQMDFMSNHVILLLNAACYNRAEQILREMLTRQERIFGKHHHRPLRTKGDLAMVLQSCGRHEESEQIYREVLQASESVLGKKHKQTLKVASKLCNLMMILGKCKEAEELARQTLTRSRGTLGEEHLQTLLMMDILAQSLAGLSQFREAEHLSRQATETVRTTLGKEHPKTFPFTRSLVHILWSSGQSLRAEELSRQLIEVHERVLGKDHPF